MDEPVVVAALRTEWLAIRSAGVRVQRCGMGAERAARWAASQSGGGSWVLLGVSGGLDPALRATDVVVATTVSDGTGDLVLSAADEVADALEGAGVCVRRGPIVTDQHLMTGRAERRAWHATGALCVDMESAPVVRAAHDRTVTVVRVVVDTVHAGLLHPATVPNGARALWTVRAIAKALRNAGLAPPLR